MLGNEASICGESGVQECGACICVLWYVCLLCGGGVCMWCVYVYSVCVVWCVCGMGCVCVYVCVVWCGVCVYLTVMWGGGVCVWYVYVCSVYVVWCVCLSVVWVCVCSVCVVWCVLSVGGYMCMCVHLWCVVCVYLCVCVCVCVCVCTTRSTFSRTVETRFYLGSEKYNKGHFLKHQ